ncbi:hypothetical protein ACFL34_02715 [Candidatus Sumerlaeota bacterium]
MFKSTRRVRRTHLSGCVAILDSIGERLNRTVVSNCLSIYDDTCRMQQKCYSHHLKASPWPSTTTR